MEFHTGAIIHSDGEQAAAAYLILEGAVGLSRSGVESLERRPGEWVSEAALLDDTACHSKLIALTDAVLLKMNRATFQQRLDQDPDLAQCVARMFAVRLRADAELQQDRNEKLQTLMDASKLINSSIQPDELIASILTVARKELNVERGTVYFVDHARGFLWSKVASGLDGSEIRLPIGQGVAGTVAATGETIILHDAYNDPRFDRSIDTRTGFQTRSVLCVPMKNQLGKVVGVLQLLNKIEADFNAQDLSFLQALSDYVAIAMENAMLHISLIEKERMENELQLAREIQHRLLPAVPTNIPRTLLSALSIPCFEVGGDYYDFLPQPEGILELAIGDASGKGVGAALVMSSLQAALRMAGSIQMELPSLVANLNALLHGMTQGWKYVTFFLARYEPATGWLRYVNCGHPPPLLISGQSILQLDATGVPIGLMLGRVWKEQQVRMQAGDRLLLYTDGLTEATSPDDQEFGIPALKSLCLQFRDTPADQMIPGIVEHITAFESGQRAQDDKTFVLLEVE